MNINGVIHWTDSQYAHLGWQVKQALKEVVLSEHLEILMKDVQAPKKNAEGFAYNIPMLNMVRFMEAHTGQEYKPYQA